MLGNKVAYFSLIGEKVMLLSSVVKGLEFTKVKGTLDKQVSSIVLDSRKAIENSIFVAISGFQTDGHKFINQAIENGANTIVVEKNISKVASDVTILKVKDARDALAALSVNFFKNPTEQLNLIGITGTNGKTSISYFIKSIFEQDERSTGVIGTNGTEFNNQFFKNDNTTPESSDLQKIFSEMASLKIDTGIMEVSSHSLELKRVAHSKFNTAIFTNLTPDHLELHGTMGNYFEAKAKLFEMSSDYNIINIDDPYGMKLVEELASRHKTIITYGVENKADVFASNIQLHDGFSEYILNTPLGQIEIRVNLPGMIYVYNSLAAAACAYGNQISLSDIKKGLSKVTSIKGRLEVVYKENGFKVVVDFAHTEDSLKKSLTTLKPFTKGKLILVFGVYAAPGEKGKGKREGMANIAANFADFSIVTSDNPKHQDPDKIVKEVGQAMKKENGKFVGIVDREEAIEYALEMSEPNDTVLLAGKGHENTQIIGNQAIPFDEAEIVQKYFKAKKASIQS